MPRHESTIIRDARPAGSAPGICFRHDGRHWVQDIWSYVFSNFGVTDLWERHRPADFKSYHKPTSIGFADELPARPLVVVAPRAGKYIQGRVDLRDFEHPEDAIYLFGGDNLNLNKEADLGSREPDFSVSVPSVKYEMYSFQAAVAVLWDRKVKYGQPDHR